MPIYKSKYKANNTSKKQKIPEVNIRRILLQKTKNHQPKIKNPYIKLKNDIPYMKKNSPENFRPLEVDPISGEYYIRIPEWIVNDLSWYEDTEIQFTIDGNEIILSEKEND